MDARGRDRIEFVDFGKGFAILAIVVYHYVGEIATGPMARYLGLGGAGVHLFFCLAGFGLMLSRHSTTAATFYRRRFVRILVPYYVFVTIVMVVNQFHAYYPHTTWFAYFGHILWYKMFDSRIIGSLGGQLWFTSTIIALYVLYPLLAAALRKVGPVRFALAALAVSAAYWVVVAAAGLSQNLVFERLFLQYLWEFCLGMALADAYLRSGFLAWELPIGTLVMACIGGYALMAAITLLGGSVGAVFNDVPSLVGFSALVALVFRDARVGAPIAVRWLGALGRVSFELFLVHMFVRAVLWPLVPAGSSVLLLGIAVALIALVAVAAAVAFQRAVEPLARSVSHWLEPTPSVSTNASDA